MKLFGFFSVGDGLKLRHKEESENNITKDNLR